MAAVAKTEVTKRLPVGDRVILVLRTSALGTDAADEWIPTGLSYIDAVIGAASLGATLALTPPGFVLNAKGTGQTEDTSPGDLGIEVGEAGENVWQITVLGRP